jgi:hypothetical protein
MTRRDALRDQPPRSESSSASESKSQSQSVPHGKIGVGGQLGDPQDAAASPARETSYSNDQRTEQDRADEVTTKPPGPGLISSTPKPQIALDLSSRLALRPAEAARTLGVSESTFRRLMPAVPHVRLAGAVLIPVEALRRWLEEQARKEKDKVDRLVDEISSAFE